MLTHLLRVLSTVYHCRYDSAGYCMSCDSRSVFIHALKQKAALAKYIDNWNLSDSFKKQLLERENYLCVNCLANYRQRIHAETVSRVLGLSETSELITRLKRNTEFVVYEAAAYSVFRNGVSRNVFGNDSIKNMSNYVVSEYFNGHPSGAYVNGIRNEDLGDLSFPDKSFDLLIDSDVLEHVGDLDKSLSEIRRVLKPGGFHVFTVPVDLALPRTRERAELIDGKVAHLMPAVMHGDTIRDSGILAFRDFGSDVLAYLSRDGLQCKEVKYYRGADFISSVYYSQRQ